MSKRGFAAFALNEASRYRPGRRLDAETSLIQLAAKYGCTPAQIVLQWHLQQGIAVIPKSSHPERIRSNIDLGHLVLDPEEIRRLNARDEYKDTSHNPYTYDYEKAGD